jgi:hypothetical protein
MRCRAAKDGDFALQCQVRVQWLINRHHAEKIGKFYVAAMQHYLVTRVLLRPPKI